jgi:hypothetical protein
MTSVADLLGDGCDLDDPGGVIRCPRYRVTVDPGLRSMVSPWAMIAGTPVHTSISIYSNRMGCIRWDWDRTWRNNGDGRTSSSWTASSSGGSGSQVGNIDPLEDGNGVQRSGLVVHDASTEEPARPRRRCFLPDLHGPGETRASVRGVDGTGVREDDPIYCQCRGDRPKHEADSKRRGRQGRYHPLLHAASSYSSSPIPGDN